jgi:hypothetical protein
MITVLNRSSARRRSLFRPTSIAGLVAWYDSRRITGRSDGDAVGSWSDLSGNSHTLTQGSVNKPRYSTNRINGRPTVLFDGVNDSLATAGFTLGQPAHLFMVITQPTQIAGGRLLDGASGNSMSLFNDTVDPSILNMYADSQGPSVTPLAGPYILRALFNHASSKIGVGSSAYQTGGDVGPGNAGGLRLGSFDGTQGFANVEFGELLVFSSEVSSADEDSKVIPYLKSGWLL